MHSQREREGRGRIQHTREPHITDSARVSLVPPRTHAGDESWRLGQERYTHTQGEKRNTVLRRGVREKRCSATGKGQDQGEGKRDVCANTPAHLLSTDTLVRIPLRQPGMQHWSARSTDEPTRARFAFGAAGAVSSHRRQRHRWCCCVRSAG